MQLEFNGKVYTEKFGIKFLRELNKKYKVEQDGMEFGVGLQGLLVELFANNVVSLIDALSLANQTEKVKFTQDQLIDAIENGEIDVEKLYDEVLSALKESNMTKMTVKNFEKNLHESK
ncbi:tail assembly chaperone [Paucilactobacillus sp. N302-9]